MSTAQALKFIEEVAADEEKRKHILTLGQTLDVGGLLQYASDLGYDFNLSQFVTAYKLWYEDHQGQLMANLSQEDIADLVSASAAKGGPVYAGGPYASPPYAANEPYAAKGLTAPY